MTGGLTVRISRAGAERLADLQPLWESLSEHHAAVAPELQALGPLRSSADSWAVRRDLYVRLLAEPDAFVLLAETGITPVGDTGPTGSPTPVGYALVHMRGPEETWASGDRVAELETLTVLPEHRGQGIGRALVEAAYGELRRLGVGQLSVGVLTANADAIRFYERLDLLPFTATFIGNVPENEGEALQ
jgi:ribosomal protein S18 acetylase RimI-like enzyme